MEDENDEDSEEEDEKCQEEEDIDLSKIILASDLIGPVNKIRKIVKHFRKSPKQNDKLQDKVRLKRGGNQVGDKVEGGDELQLPREVRTRWNSLLHVLQAYITIQVPIEQTLSASGKLYMAPDKQEMKIINGLTNALTVFEILTLELSKRDTSLAKADREFEWGLGALKSFKTPIATHLYQSLLNRVLQRRQQDIATLHAYLEKSTFLDMVGNEPKHLSYSSRKDLAKTALDLYVRLFSNEDEDHEVIDIVEESPEDVANQVDDPEPEQVDDPEPDEDSSPPAKMRLYEDHKNYQKRLEKTSRKKSLNLLDKKEILRTIKRDMVLYEDTGSRGKLLEKIYSVLKSIPPTSTEAEGG